MSASSNHTTTGEEDARLNAAMARGDELLRGALQADERRRRRTKLLWTLGGIAMLTALCLIVAAALNYPVDEAQRSATKPSKLAAAPTKDTATQKDPEKAASLTQAGWSLWQQQQLAAAIEKFDAALKLDPDNTNALNGLGWARLNGGEYAAAREAFDRLLKREPKHAAALNGLGQMALAERDYVAAEKHLLKAAPSAPAAWYGLARVYLLTGKYNEAAKWLRKIENSGEKDPTVAEMLDAARAKELPDALRIKIEPPPVTGVAKLVAEGWRLKNQGRTADAQAVFARALAESPEDPAALNGMGWLLISANDPQAARSFFERALKVEPLASGAMNGLGQSLHMSGEVDGAIAVWEQMVEKIPGVHAGTVSLANAYLEKEEFDKAAPLLEQLVAAEPNSVQFKQKLARAQDGARE